MSDLGERMGIALDRLRQAGPITPEEEVQEATAAIAPDVETTEGLSIQDWYLWMGMHCDEIIEKRWNKEWAEVISPLGRGGFSDYRLKPKQKLPRKGSLPSWQHGPVCDAIEITSDVYIKIGDEYVLASEMKDEWDL